MKSDSKKIKLFIKRGFKFDQSWVGFIQHHFYILKSKVLSHYNNLRDFAKESLFKLKINGAGFTPHHFLIIREKILKYYNASRQFTKESLLKFQISGAGFTIMETVMVLGVFTIAATYSLAIFVQSNTVQKRTANIQRTLADARYAMEVMAREFRMGQIDYDTYGGPLSSPEHELYLLDINNNSVGFRRFEESGNGKVQLFSGDHWLDVTPPDLNISRLDFYLSPPEDPFVWNGSGYNYDQQPRLTIILTSESLHQEGGLLQDPRTAHFQTTVTSRKYVR